MIRIDLPYPPSANHYKLTRVYYDKATRQHKVMWYLSDEAKAFKSEVGWLAKAAGLRTPFAGFVRVRMYLTPQCPKDVTDLVRKSPAGWALKVRSHDVGNVEKVVSDALNGIAWLDDRQVDDLRVIRTEPGKRGLMVEIEEFVPDWVKQPTLFPERSGTPCTQDGFGVLAG